VRSGITAAVVTWNAAGIADDLVSTLGPLMDRCRVVVSDNDSTDGTPEILRNRLPGLEVLRNRANGGFGYGCNRVLESCGTEYLLLLNADARITPSGVDSLAGHLGRFGGAGGVQPLVRLWGWPLITLSAGCSMTGHGYGYDMDFMHFDPAPSRLVDEVPCITAALSLWRTSVLREIGGFDERMFMYFEDVDLGLRVRGTGRSLLLAGDVEAEHVSGASSGRSSAERWELRSAAYLTMKYLGSGKLPAYWRRSEGRAVLGRFLRCRPWMWRLREVMSARKAGGLPVELPEGVISSVLEPRPLRMPNPRPPAPSFNEGFNGPISAGPGWDGGRTGPWGFGCIGTDKCGGTLELKVCSPVSGGTVALWSDSAVLDRTYIGAGRRAVLRGELPAGGRRAYLVPDNGGQTVELEEAHI